MVEMSFIFFSVVWCQVSAFAFALTLVRNSSANLVFLSLNLQPPGFQSKDTTCSSLLFLWYFEGVEQVILLLLLFFPVVAGWPGHFLDVPECTWSVK